MSSNSHKRERIIHYQYFFIGFKSDVNGEDFAKVFCEGQGILAFDSLS